MSKKRKVTTKATAATTAPAKDKAKAVPVGRSTISSCVCVSPFQDDEQGRGRRVHNVGQTRITCTVCGRQGFRPAATTGAKAAA